MVAREDWVAGRELKQRRMVAEIEIFLMLSSYNPFKRCVVCRPKLVKQYVIF